MTRVSVEELTVGGGFRNERGGDSPRRRLEQAAVPLADVVRFTGRSRPSYSTSSVREFSKKFPLAALASSLRRASAPGLQHAPEIATFGSQPQVVPGSISWPERQERPVVVRGISDQPSEGGSSMKILLPNV